MADEESRPLDYVSEIVLSRRKKKGEPTIRRTKQLEQRFKKSKGDNRSESVLYISFTGGGCWVHYTLVCGEYS
ncbi:hypothetical protein Hanom_Chr07g00609931 [Helianthus anomalus]